MNPALIGLIGLILVILGHIVTTVWWAATITANLKNIGQTILNLSKNNTENENTHKLLWKRQDDLGTRVTIIETRLGSNHKE